MLKKINLLLLILPLIIASCKQQPTQQIVVTSGTCCSTAKPGEVVPSGCCVDKKDGENACESNCCTKAEFEPVKEKAAPKAPNKKVKDMTFDEAKEAKAYYDADNNEALSIECAQRLIALGTDQEVVRVAILELAQIFLNNADYEKAQKYASDYHLLFPGTDQAKEASYLAIKAAFLSTLTADRDQTKTQATLELAQNFVTRYTNDNEYVQSVNDMQNACYEKLLDSEIKVVDTYMSRYNYSGHDAPLKAANNRVAYIKDKLLPHLPSEEERILNLELTIAQSSNKPELVAQKQLEIATKFGPNKDQQAMLLAQETKKAAYKF